MSIASAILGVALFAVGSFVPGLNIAIWSGAAWTYSGLLIGAGFALASSSISALLAPKVSAGFSGARRSRQISVGPETIAYGLVADGGDVRFMDGHGDDNKLLSTIFCLAAHQCQSLEALVINGKKITLQSNAGQFARFATNDLIPAVGQKYYQSSPEQPLVGVGFYNGTQTTADAYLVSKSGGKWTNAHVGRLHSYARLTLRYAEPEFKGGIPTCLFVFKGKPVYDPRTESTVWSDNPALIALDWMRSSFGPSAPLSAFDIASVITAANVCEEQVPLKAGGFTNRYRCSMIAKADRPWRDVLADIENAMCGRVIDTGVPIKFYAGKYRSPTLTITTKHITGDFEFVMDRDQSDLVNAAKGRFYSEDHDYVASETVLVTDQDYVDEDGGRPFVETIDLPGVPITSQAQRIVKAMVSMRRKQWTMTMSIVAEVGLELEAWDVITVDMPELGIDSEVAIVEEIDFQTLVSGQGIGITVRGYGDHWEWDPHEEGETVVPVYVEGPDPTWDDVALTGVSATHELRQEAGSQVTSVIRVNWSNPPEITSQTVEVRWRTVEIAAVGDDGRPIKFTGNGTIEDYGSSYVGGWRSTLVDTASAAAVLTDIEPYVKYEIQVRLVKDGNYGPLTTVFCWTEDSYSQVDPPYQVSGRQVDVNSVQLKWRVVRRRDISSIEIMHARGNDFDEAKPIVNDTSGRLQHTVHDLENGSHYFWIRTIQRDGRRSPVHIGSPMIVIVDSNFGALAKLDKVSSLQIEPYATTRPASQAFDSKENVGNAYEEIAFKVYDIEQRDGTAALVNTYYSFIVGASQPCTQVLLRMKVDGVETASWTWNKVTDQIMYPRDHEMLLLQVGRRRISLEARTVGGASLFTKIKFQTTLHI